MDKSLFNKALDAYNKNLDKQEGFIHNEPLINYSTSDEGYVYLADHSGEKGKYEISSGKIIFDTQ